MSPPHFPSPSTRVKQLKIYSLLTKTRIARQLKEKVGPCPDHMFFTPEIRRSPNRKGPCRPNRKQCQGMLYLDAFAVESILAKRCMCTHMGES